MRTILFLLAVFVTLEFTHAQLVGATVEGEVFGFEGNHFTIGVLNDGDDASESFENASLADVTVLTENLQFVPRDITIEVGETVRWSNPETNVPHNVNGQQSLFPCNAVSFFSGIAENGLWDYEFTFSEAGFYEYQCDPHTSVDMFGSVTVVDPNAPDVPEYAIGTVKAIDSDGVAAFLDTLCVMEGVVYGRNMRSQGLEFAMIDDNGDGIIVFKENTDCYEVTQGDRIRVTGVIGQGDGLIRIEPNAGILVVSTGNASLEDVPGVPSEIVESRNIRLPLGGWNVVEIEEVDSSGWKVTLVDFETEMITVTAWMDADLFDQPQFAIGGPYEVRGIAGQFDPEIPFDEGYQIIPQFEDDTPLILSVPTLPESAMTVFPNPVKNFLHISTDYSIDRVEVYSANGGLEARFSRLPIDISSLASGVYVLKVLTTEGIWIGRITKAN